MTRERARQLNPLVLAYLGDAVHALWVKRALVLSSDAKVGFLHGLSGKILSAKEQSALSDRLYEVLTDEERDIFRRARNCHNNTAAKNATLGEYKKATGLEAVLGYLFLVGDADRMESLLKTAYENTEEFDL